MNTAETASAPSSSPVWLACSLGCSGRFAPDEIRYRCPSCNGLLDVRHDEEALARVPAEEWRRRFDARGPQRAGWDASGVWSKREWVLPGVTESEAVSLGEGYTPLVPVPALARALDVGELWIKQCGTAHTGSFKDLGMSVLVTQVRRMRERGHPIRAVVCASTGDTSAALAAYGAAAGFVTCVLLPRGKITTAQLVQPLANGAVALALDTDFDGCMRVVQQLAADPTFYLANSMNAWRVEGQKTVALEIVQQLGWEPPDWIALPGGNLGNSAAIGAGLGLVERLAGVPRRTRILVGQVERANPLFLSQGTGFTKRPSIEAGETAATAIRIGAPVSYERAIAALRRCGGTVTQASENELAEAAAEADRFGLYLCPQTAAALAGIRKARAAGEIGPGEKVVLVSTAHGLKFTEFKVAYHEGRLADAECRQANPPIQIAGTLDAVRRALEPRLAEAR